jgi:hypothetical protein
LLCLHLRSLGGTQILSSPPTSFPWSVSTLTYNTTLSNAYVFLLVNGTIAELGYFSVTRFFNITGESSVASSSTVPSIIPPPPTAKGATQSHLSTGAKAGIGISVWGFAIGLLAVGIITYQMRRRRRESTKEHETQPTKEAEIVPKELGSDGAIYEIASGNEIHELSSVEPESDISVVKG